MFEINSINLSLLFGLVSFLISLIVLTLAKPDIFTKINDKNKKVIKWSKLLLVIFIIGLGVSICSFLVLNKENKYSNNKPKMGFNENY